MGHRAEVGHSLVTVECRLCPEDPSVSSEQGPSYALTPPGRRRRTHRMADDKQPRDTPVADLWLSLAPGDPWSHELFEVIRRFLRDACPKLPRSVGLDGQTWTDDLMWDLATSCYYTVILGQPLESRDGKPRSGQLQKLQAMAREGANCGGYLRQMVRNFVEDRRRRHDPHRPAIFRRLRNAITEWEAQGRLTVTRRLDGRITVQSVITFLPPEPASRELAELGSFLRGWPAWGRVAARLATKGTAATSEVFELLGHLAAFGGGPMVLDAVLTVLYGCVPEKPEQLGQEAIDGATDRSVDASDPEALVERIRIAIDARPGLGVHRERMAKMWAAFTAERDRHESSEEHPLYVPNQTSLGKLCGLERQRASEAWNKIRELAAGELGSAGADMLGDRPSGS